MFGYFLAQFFGLFFELRHGVPRQENKFFILVELMQGTGRWEKGIEIRKGPALVLSLPLALFLGKGDQEQAKLIKSPPFFLQLPDNLGTREGKRMLFFSDKKSLIAETVWASLFCFSKNELASMECFLGTVFFG